MLDFTKKGYIIVVILMLFWGIVLGVLLNIAQPLPPTTLTVLIVCMAITAFLILLDGKPIGGIPGAMGILIVIALGSWSLLVILSTRLVSGYYPKYPNNMK